jgi:hypothetical protein
MLNFKIDKLKLGKLIMFLLTDGNVSISEDRKFEISFVNHNFVLITEFIKISEALFGKLNFQLKILPTGQFRVAFFSKSIVNFLHEFSPSFRKKRCREFRPCPLLLGKSNFPCKFCKPTIVGNDQFPPAQVPGFIFKLPVDEICEVLRVLTSTEGCVTIQVREVPLKIEREVTIGCRHPILRQQFKKLFQIVGIPFKERQDRLFISDIASMKLFQQKVGFIKGVVVSRKNSQWFGVEKNTLLSLALTSFKLKSLGSTREAVLQQLRRKLTSLTIDGHTTIVGS